MLEQCDMSYDKSKASCRCNMPLHMCIRHHYFVNHTALLYVEMLET